MINRKEVKTAEIEEKKTSSFKADGDSAELSTVIDKQIKSLQQLIKVCEIDTNEWVIDRWVCNKWEMGAKLKDDTIKVTPLFQVKVWLKRNKPVIDLNRFRDGIIKAMRKHSPKYPKLKYPKSEPNLFEINLADLHLGKLAWDEETGNNFDLPIAENVFDATIDKLIIQAKPYNVDRIAFIVGNDFFNVDNSRNTTTNNTPQDEDTRWHKTFNRGVKLIVKQIDKLSGIAPVDVIIVPGNHDTERAFYLGVALSCWYRNSKNVTVDNQPKPRKYYKYGLNLLGYTHGNEEKVLDLPVIMASEVPQLWAETKYREWHLGHIHQKKEIKWVSTQEHKGTVIRYMRSLTGTDAWHNKKAFIGNVRAGEGFIWNKDNGLICQFTACL